MNKKIGELVELIGSEGELYEETLESDLGNGMLADILIEMAKDSRQFNYEMTLEGRRYINKYLLVKNGEPFPKIGLPYPMVSPLTKRRYEAVIMGIEEINWNADEEGGIIVCVLIDAKTKGLKADG